MTPTGAWHSRLWLCRDRLPKNRLGCVTLGPSLVILIPQSRGKGRAPKVGAT
jgi:hypothetical protein